MKTMTPYSLHIADLVDRWKPEDIYNPSTYKHMEEQEPCLSWYHPRNVRQNRDCFSGRTQLAYTTEI